MSQVISDLGKIELVSIFNRYIKEFFLFLLQKIFVNTTSFDRLARTKIVNGVRLLRINNRTPYFLEYWFKNFPNNCRDPIKNGDVQFFQNQTLKSSDQNSLQLFELLKKKGTELSSYYQNNILLYLKNLLITSDQYIKGIMNNNCVNPLKI